MAKMKECIGFVLENEGGYSDDPEDSGGATNLGLTHDDIARFRGHSVSDDDVRNLTMTEAFDIYRKFYWNIMRLDEVNDQKLATALFDMGVNRGISRGIKYAQIACNSCGASPELKVDGHVGKPDKVSKTIAALNAVDRKKFIPEFERLVVAGYEAIIANNPSQEEFRHGWMNRAKRLLTLT